MSCTSEVRVVVALGGGTAMKPVMTPMLDAVSACRLTLGVRVAAYEDGNRLVRSCSVPIRAEGSSGDTEVVLGGERVLVRWTVRPTDDGFGVEAVVSPASVGPDDDRVLEGMSVSVEVGLDGWDTGEFVLMPGAVYGGNRHPHAAIGYPSMFREAHPVAFDARPVVSDIPRLGVDGGGPHRIQQLAGDLAVPVIAVLRRKPGFGVLLSGPQRECGYSCGYEVQESDGKATLRVSVPGVREEHRYFICNTSFSSSDRGAGVSATKPLTVHAHVRLVRCGEVSTLLERVFVSRAELSSLAEARPGTGEWAPPFSAVARLITDKHNQSNWDDEQGLYRVGIGTDPCCFWQPGWVGGIMPTLSFLVDADPGCEDRVYRNLDFLFSRGQAESGWFYGLLSSDGRSIGDGFGHAGTTHWTLTRKSADALLMLTRQMLLLGEKAHDRWLDGTFRCAEALCRTWKNHGQWGQMVDDRTGEVVVGGSTSASTAPGALAMASVLYSRPEMLEVASDSLRRMHEWVARHGLTCGGPGEALQCPDSESAFGLLDSMATLWQVTGDRVWLEKARDVAHIAATWVMSYDFEFPEQSLFGRLEMRSRGTVFANAQNKHSAPGICTGSGVGLLHLFRGTGDRRYIELLRDIAATLPQYVSRDDRPIGLMPQGWINERVNTSDWLEPVGEIFNGSCWPEVSMLLTYTEVPGVYAQPDTGLIVEIDAVRGSWTSDGRLELLNPTRWDADVKVLLESSAESSAVLPLNPWRAYRRVRVGAGARVVVC